MPELIKAPEPIPINTTPLWHRLDKWSQGNLAYYQLVYYRQKLNIPDYHPSPVTKNVDLEDTREVAEIMEHNQEVSR